MRLLGIIAVFVLAVTTIVEGAFLIRLSGQVADLKEEVRLPARSPMEEAGSASDAARSASAQLAAERVAARKAPIPKLEATAPAPTPAEAVPATSVLQSALSTEEGRKHLKQALGVIKEQERQLDLVQDVERDLQGEQRYRDRLNKTLGLTSSEQGGVNSIYATMQSKRQRILDEMRSGLKSADQADDEIDNLVDDTEKQVQTLLGDGRMRQLREARRNERMQWRQQRDQQREAQRQGQAPPPGSPARPQAVPPPN
jgi:hypothetical protein